MGVETIGLLAVSAALGALGTLTRKQQRQRTIGWDEQPTALATRGAFAPVVIGRGAVAPLFLWAGDRITSGGGGGGKGLGGGSGGSVNYDEAAWHGLCLGPIDTLHSIRVDSKAIYTGPLAALAGSGVSIACVDPHPGTAYVYFGEATQPVNTRLGAGSGAGTTGTGISSRWPRMCYVEYRRLRLGTGPQWPNLLYEVERRPSGVPDLGSAVWISESSAGAKDDGVNAAHALWDLLTNPFLGGIPCERLNCACFRDLASACAAERLAVNMVVAGQSQAAEAVSALLGDMGVGLAEVFNADASVRALQFSPRLVRSVPDGSLSSLPLLTRDVVADPPEVTEQMPPIEASRVAFVFPDRTINYRDQPVTRDDDAAVDGSGSVATQSVRLTTVIDSRTATIIADRRADEALAPATTIRVNVLRGAVTLAPGQQFRMALPGETVERVWAVLSKSREPGGVTATLQAAQVRYGETIAGPGSPLPPAPPAPGFVQADAVFVPQELPLALSGTESPRLGVLRVSGSAATSRGVIYGSSDGTSFAVIGYQPQECFGGTLEATFGVGNTIAGRSGDGPVIVAYAGGGSGMAQAEDLSAAALLADWLGGRQPALIGTGAAAEIVFVRSVTSLGSGRWRLNSVARGRMDTAAASWPAGTPVLFFGAASRRVVNPITEYSLLTPGRTAHVKSVPQDSGGAMYDISLVTAQQLPIVGRSARPLSVCNLRGNGRPDGQATYGASDPIQITWAYRVRNGLGRAAGEISAIGQGQPGRDGPFEIEVWSPAGGGATRKRTLTLDSDDTRGTGVTYANATNAADHSGTPASSIEFRAYATRGTYRSPVATIVVNKV